MALQRAGQGVGGGALPRALSLLPLVAGTAHRPHGPTPPHPMILPRLPRQAIIARLRRRELYKYVTDALIPPELLERGQWVPPTAQDVVNSYRGSDVKLCADDIILQVATAHSGSACGYQVGLQLGPHEGPRHRLPPTAAGLAFPSIHARRCLPFLAEQENKIDYSKARENPLDRCGQAGSYSRWTGCAGGARPALARAPPRHPHPPHHPPTWVRPLPTRSVRFFDSLDATESRKLRPDQISSMVVASYQVGGWALLYDTAKSCLLDPITR